MTIIMGMVKMKRWHLGLRGAGFKKRVGTGNVLVMEINLTAEKNYDENRSLGARFGPALGLSGLLDFVLRTFGRSGRVTHASVQ